MASQNKGERATHMQKDTKGQARRTRRDGAQGRGSHAAQGAQDLSHGAVKMSSALDGGHISRASADATKRSARPTASHAARERKRSKLGPIVLVLALVVAILGVASVVVPRFIGANNDSDDSPTVVAGTEVNVVIPEGAGASEIATLLHDSGVISSTSDFLQAVSRKDAESSIQSGSYTFVAGDDVADIVDLLTSGPNNTEGRLTIPEGYTLTQIAAAVEETLDIPSDSFVAQAKASNYASDYSFLAEAAATSYDSLEGFLFPKTYDFAGQEGVTADTVIRAMLSQYQVELANYDTAAAEESLASRFGISFTDYDVLIVASIVEKETNTPGEDGAHVASVIYNRLATGTLLQLDTTSAYGNGGVLTTDVVSADWDNPYNTYRYTGLPPTPLCSPSLESFEAALNPDDTDDLYFYITDDYHVFSQTYEEHQQAIANAPSASDDSTGSAGTSGE